MQNSTLLTSRQSDQEVIDNIERERYAIISPLFRGAFLGCVKVKRLSSVEIESCGNFSLIETFTDKIRSQNISEDQVNQYGEFQHRIIKKALVSPTYEQIMEVFELGECRSHFEQWIDQTEVEISDMKDGPKRTKKERELNKWKREYYSILPHDFIGPIMATALRLDHSDIKLVTEEMLLEAAYLAAKCNNSPADHLKGEFTEFNIKDINRRALILLHEEEKKRSQARGSRRRIG